MRFLKFHTKKNKTLIFTQRRKVAKKNKTLIFMQNRKEKRTKNLKLKIKNYRTTFNETLNLLPIPKKTEALFASKSLKFG